MAKQITIISGKGGSGKTTITAAFTALAKNHVIVDADVDAAQHLHANRATHKKGASDHEQNRGSSRQPKQKTEIDTSNHQPAEDIRNHPCVEKATGCIQCRT